MTAPRVHAQVQADELVVGWGDVTTRFAVTDVVRVNTYPGMAGERDVRIELAPGVEPSPLMLSMRAPDAESLVDEITRAVFRLR